MSAPRVTMRRVRRFIGDVGERAAWRTYRQRGYRLVARNWRCPLGELDLVLARAGLVVFCEVKTRTGADLGGPFEAVTLRKQLRLRRLAEAFLAARLVDPERCRFDVASVTLDDSGAARVHLFEDAF